MTNQLIGINFDGGVQMPHFVNGRLLTASDLQAEQDAMLARLGQLGKAAGWGVVTGLVVSPAPGANRLRVSSGLGVTRSGHCVQLGEQGAELSLLIAPDLKELGEDAGRFQACGLDHTVTGITQGAYVLTARPVSRLEGSAPVKSMRGNLSTCESKWEVDGVEFHAILLAGFKTPGGPTDRNLLAHWCFGSDGLRRLPLDPYDVGLEDFLKLLPPNLPGLTECDLPLAVFTWTPTGLGILDTWAARRRVTHAYPSPTWDALVSDARAAEGQARFLQFQEQLENVRSNDKPSTVAVSKYFRYLPPMGFVPVTLPGQFLAQLVLTTAQEFAQLIRQAQQVQTLLSAGVVSENDWTFFANTVVAQLFYLLYDRAVAALAGAGTFDLQTFFGEYLPEQIGVADFTMIEAALQDSWRAPAIDLQEKAPPVPAVAPAPGAVPATPAVSSAPIELYIVREALMRRLRAIQFLLLQPPTTRQDLVKPLSNQEGGVQRLLPIWLGLWEEGGLKAAVYGAIGREPGSAVQEVADNVTVEQYVVFVKRSAPVEWLRVIFRD